MQADKPCIYIIEDDEAVRDSLALVLDSVGYQVKQFATADAFLSFYNPNLSGCIVLDIRMPGMDGMELQMRLNTLNSILPIIFVTGHGDVPMAVEAMQRGALDFVQKPYREQELLGKITAALKLDEENRQSLEEKQKIVEYIASLTPREHEVMEGMVAGKANKVIAFDLDISQRTVEIHRARVMEKLNAKSLAHLVRMIMTVGAEAPE
jgi:two-component system response regulator FixJ